MSAGKRSKMIAVHSVAEIPPNMTEDEEHHFWETHCLGEELLAQMESPGVDGLPAVRDSQPRPRKRTIPAV
jgi:hypothetical protein